MNLEALCLLETPTVRRLVATWPQVGGEADKATAIRRWAEISNVHPKIVNKWFEPLLANKIIMFNGQIDAAAADYIAQCALSRAKFQIDRKTKRHDA